MGRTGAAMSSRPSGRAAMGRVAIRTAKAALEAEHAAAARAKAEQAVAAGSQEQAPDDRAGDEAATHDQTRSVTPLT